ncbi:hypothetical protein PV11_03826 [Exophiala sideris]|uniref:Uncharacterized protein n=1 Tax=Exophiala sideris TaxID=1016849 RepID=A0A0D1YFI3_9EURO|nr:hypothetical protein PV11_03826 [Exophiala sideris]
MRQLEHLEVSRHTNLHMLFEKGTKEDAVSVCKGCLNQSHMDPLRCSAPDVKDIDQYDEVGASPAMICVPSSPLGHTRVVNKPHASSGWLWLHSINSCSGLTSKSIHDHEIHLICS